jgi:hypothetical protein
VVYIERVFIDPPEQPQEDLPEPPSLHPRSSGHRRHHSSGRCLIIRWGSFKREAQ